MCVEFLDNLFNFAQAQLPSTDTKTVYLPDSLEIFPSLENNTFFYKFLISLQWGHVESRIFSQMCGSSNFPQPFLAQYPDGKLAADLFSVLQFIHVFRHLESELPGLIRQGREMCAQLIGKISVGGIAKERCVALQHLLLQGIRLKKNSHDVSAAELKPHGESFADILDVPVLEGLPEIYAKFSCLSGTYTLGSVAPASRGI